MKDYYALNKQALMNYFEEGSKGCICESLGVEIEHFVGSKTLAIHVVKLFSANTGI